MKLGIISPYPPLKGGIAKETEIIHCILKNTYNIKIFSFSNLYPNWLYPDNTQFDNSYKNNKFKNIDFCINSFNPTKWKFSANKIIDSGCTHIIIRYWNPFFIPIYLYLMKMIKKNNNHVRIYCMSDNILPHERFIFDKYITMYFFKKFNGHMVMSDNSEKLLKKVISNPNLIIRSFLPLKKIYNKELSQDEALNKLQINKPKLLLLFFGLIRDYKRLDIVIKAINQIKKYDIKLLIAGKCYRKKNTYVKLINKYKLQDKVIWHDKYIPDSQISLYFSAVDAVVLSHENISQSGIVPLAYHFNKLIIASNIDSFRKDVVNRETGYFFKKNDTSSLSEIIINIYKKHDFLLSKKYIKKYKNKYSEDKILEDFSLLFQL